MSISDKKNDNKHYPDAASNNNIHVLIVDDEEPVRRLLSRLLDMNGYLSTIASNAEEARSIMSGNDFELLLCDVNMPGESGLDFIKHVYGSYPETAVIMVTGEDDTEFAEMALDIGAYGYVIKPFRPNELMINISNALRRKKLEIDNKATLANLENIVYERTSELQKTLQKLRKSTKGIIQAMSSTVETRDPYTAGHQQRTANFAKSIAKEMGLSHERVEGIMMAGLIHDLGKIAVPSEILTKPGKLTDIEFSLIKVHPQTGYDILKEIDFPWPIARIIIQHHERINGSGYPHGLSGDDLLLESKIMAVSDVVEAMASHRPYRAALGLEIALDEILKNKGALYDPSVVDSCVKIISTGNFRLESS